MDIVEEMCCILIKFIYCMCVVISKKKWRKASLRQAVVFPLFILYSKIFWHCKTFTFLLVLINFSHILLLIRNT